MKGAEQVAYIAQFFDVKEAYFKEKSPACGVNFIKRGDEKIEGSGVASALIIRFGVVVYPVE